MRTPFRIALLILVVLAVGGTVISCFIDIFDGSTLEVGKHAKKEYLFAIQPIAFTLTILAKLVIAALLTAFGFLLAWRVL